LITAIVKYRLSDSISREDCRAHFHSIAPNFQDVPGLISKHFICDADGLIAGGIYQWNSLSAAESFYSGPWLSGILARYGMKPDIQFFDVFARTDNTSGSVDCF